jgi:(4-alkanoyl-5-oxo-2,5-dihydrofuran-3-yl)methyl phosphate reductase
MIYLITGATGNVGSLVADGLIARGHRPRIFVRDATKARARYGGRVDIFTGDLADVKTLRPALADADALFLVNSGPDLAVLDGLAAEAAKVAGVRHLVKLSSYDAREQNVGTGVWHAAGEAAIRASGISFTFIQPSGFMTNALYWASSIKAAGIVRTATGDGKIPFIHPVDIAEVAVKALTEPENAGRSLPITGPEALSYADMTAKIGAVIGKALRFQAMSEDEARAQQIAWNAPPPLVEARLSIFRAIREGRLATVTEMVERVLGRQPISFDQWARENVQAFQCLPRVSGRD